MATDQEIRDAGLKYVPKQKYLQDPYNLSTPPPDGGITNTNAFTNSGDNGQQFYTGGTNNLVSDFQSSIDDRQNRLNKPIDTSTFMGKIKGFMNPQSANQIMAEGYQPQMKLGILANLLPDKYGTLPRADQAFIAQNMGYTGPTVFGENTGNQDIFGTNVRSAFGNYGERVGVEATNLGAQLGGRLSDKYGAEFDEETGMFVGPNAAKANEMTKMMRAKLDFYRNKKIERDDLQKESLVGQMKRDKEAGAAGKSDPQDQSRTGSSGRRPGSGGNVERRDSGPDRNTDSGNTTYDSGGREGFGYGLKEGGRAGYFFGGRVNYKTGGRINFRGGGMDMGNEENQKTSAEMGNTTVSNNNDGGNDNPPNFFVEDKTSIVDTSGLKSKSPEININYTDPRNYASLKSRVYNTNILDNDDINVDGTLSGEIGPVSYNTNFTDQGITGTNLTAGNFNADIDANKNYSIGYANNYNGIDYGTTYDSNGNLMFNAGVKFKNGGLASIL